MDKELDTELMEECIICFDKTDKFIVFMCKHKTCEKCYPLIMEQRPNCPLCNHSLLPHTAIQIGVIEPQQTCLANNKCNLCFYFILIVILIFFIENNNL
jgi:hypothetical protein